MEMQCFVVDTQITQVRMVCIQDIVIPFCLFWQFLFLKIKLTEYLIAEKLFIRELRYLIILQKFRPLV